MKKEDIKNKNSDEVNHSETARKVLTERVPIVLDNMDMGSVKKILFEKSRDYEMMGYIYVINKKDKISGVFPIKDVFRFSDETKVRKIMNKTVICVRPNTDQERAALLAIKHNIKAMPVVDKNNRFMGVITPTKIMEILHMEGIEDALRSAGVNKFKDPAVELIHSSTYNHFKKRAPWLVLGLIGGIISAVIISFFEHFLSTFLILASFIPAVVYMADAVGAQSQTIFIRSLALDKKLEMAKYILRELKVNILLGISLGLLFFLVILIGWKEPVFAVVLGISIFTTVMIAMAVSITLPLIFQNMKLDPAITTGPFGTAIRDLTSILVYFGIAYLMIGIFM